MAIDQGLKRLLQRLLLQRSVQPEQERNIIGASRLFAHQRGQPHFALSLGQWEFS